MKKLFAGSVVLLVSIFILGATAIAATTPQVSGTIALNGSPAASANVNISCMAAGGAQHVRNVTTSSTGHYNASFAAGQCNDGAAVVVIASSSDGNAFGQASGVMGDGGTTQHIEIDVGLSASVPLPEFVPLTVTLAVSASAALITIIRRKSRTFSG